MNLTSPLLSISDTICQVNSYLDIEYNVKNDKIGQKKDFIVSFSAKQNRRATRQNTQITLLFDGCEYDGGSDPE
jgi:hypothetical protein